MARARLLRPLARRGGWQPRAVLLVALVWVLLWDRLSLGNVVNGLILGVVITRLFPLPAIGYRGRLHPLPLLALVGRFLVDLVRSSVEVAWVVLRPGPLPPSSVIEVPLRTGSELYLTLVATVVGLEPGSTVIEARRTAGVLFVHVLGAGDDDARERAREKVLSVERAVVRAVGNEQEIAACAGGHDDRGAMTTGGTR